MILYHLLFIAELDAANAEMTADAIIMYRTFGQGPQFFLDAIEGALASDAEIMTEGWAEPPHDREDLRHTEADMREFLAMVAGELRRRQPWPPKPERKR
ncbi:hypothetical protein [Mycolicibacterium neworleansense]|uniref:Uncharacterized protein n=1 Tax=Mycolicibacterium neworleansense TaxID=146018 RepID=A0A0H5S7E6_9MYCO|nr:hypothetical protein [Mycolicibacterium neworleansense]MCV7363265.1 hypothetical protein [Mycolicibacterium neworleansense]CRZ17159.1 hypothetical protein BN2156_04040 [Mycolicibacterium neworleansense]